jgi:signal transduction histidine kinase
MREFLTVTAHQLSLPIQSLLADAANLASQLREGEAAQDTAQHLFNEGRALQLVVENILHGTMDRSMPPPTLVKEDILRPLLAGCEMFDAEARAKGCAIRVHIQSDRGELPVWPRGLRGQTDHLGLPSVEMDRSQLELAFKNLLSNAVKYSFRPPAVPGPRRTIDVGVRFRGNDTCEVSFTNYGVGIAREEIEKGLIWTSGYRGVFSRDRNRVGAGLGLALVKRTIEETHGGRVSVQSFPVLGGAFLTTFTVTLPISHREPSRREG